ncbi:TIP41-like protein [Microplitis mediator]|uniref:TIP41-like protein n=1 Tax=Microplitis mediator TaxID=375433 RepID=UPI002555B904|nr:TIP41-like protein [Microplitis mediator]
MTTIKVHGGIDILRLPVNQEEHIFPPWQIKYTQSHILHSKCSKHEESCPPDVDPCQFCEYNNALEMPHMPDMVFPNNILTLKHERKAEFNFNALDALKRVANGKINLKLACAEAWQESRSDCKEYLQEKVKPFDWTFTTDYMGTSSGFQVTETDERIDMEKLKRKDKILFYHDLTLFEDELHDNGIASLSVKIRVMPGSLFILLRYFLRIDNVMLRINDTRIYHEFHKDYLLREFTTRESQVQDLKVPHALFVDPSQIAPFLPLINSLYHKLLLPPKADTVTPKSSLSKSLNVSNESESKNSEASVSNSVT